MRVGTCFSSLLKEFPHGLQLKEEVPLQVLKSGQSVRVLGKKPFRIDGLMISETKQLEALKKGISLSDLKHLEKYPKLIQVLQLLFKLELLRGKAPESDPRQVLDRQIQWLSHYHSGSHRILESLKQKRILILGCGGTGAVVTEHLARAGFSRFVLIDSSEVDLPDLNRQMPYHCGHIGSPKAEVLSLYLKSALGPVFKIEEIKAYQQKIVNAEDLLQIANKSGSKKFDLMINCADKPMGLIQKQVCQASILLNCPVLFGSVGLEAGTVGPFLMSEDAKRFFAESAYSAHQEWSQDHQVLLSSICFTNSQIAVQMAFQAFLFLSGNSNFSLYDQSYDLNFFNGKREEPIHWRSKKGEAWP